MILYLYSKCSTCQNAKRYLEKKGIIIPIKEINVESPTVNELKKMLEFQQGNIKKIMNTSGILYREMQLSSRIAEMPLTEIFNLLNQHGMLVKRPFLLGSDFGLTGFKEAEWDQAFSYSRSSLCSL
jgi:arsenate reductase